MNNMTKLISTLCLTLISFTSAHAEPTQLPGNIAVHIAKAHYLHPVRLLHPYLDVWHMKGPLAEKAVMPVLKAHFTNVNECTSDSEASVVLLLEPHVFYNPQLHVFHTQLIAQAYTNNGAPIMHIKKETQELGMLSSTPDFFIEKAYIKAINAVIEALSSEQPLIDALNKNTPIKAGDICHHLDNLPLNNFYY
jgi:hypothetical protein